MASSTTNTQAPNLATLLLIKRQIATKNGESTNTNQALLPPAATGAYSNERVTYHQNVPAVNMQETMPNTLPAKTTEQPKVSRKAKQIEVELLDKKMEEINRKQEVTTNETLGSWKGFDSINYGFTPQSAIHKSTPVPPVSANQRTHTPIPSPKRQPSLVKTPSRQTTPVKTPEKTVTELPRQQSPVKQQSVDKHPSPTPRTPSPKRIDSPAKDQTRTISPPKEKETRPPEQKPIEKPSTPPPEQKPIEKPSTPPPEQKPIEKPSTPPPEQKPSTPPPEQKPPTPPPQQKPVERSPIPPTPPPRRKSFEKLPSRSSPAPSDPKANSAPSLKRGKSPGQLQSKSEPSKPPTPITEDIIPISSILTNPQLFEKNIQAFEQPSSPISSSHHLKLFPDIKHYEIKKPQNARKSIQRSMDRYRFYVW